MTPETNSPSPFTRSQAGFTLIELLVATAMMIIITAAAVSMLVSAMTQQPKITAKADQIGEARAAMEKLVNDVRQGSSVSSASATGFTLATYCDGSSGKASPCNVTYSCAQESGKATFRCTRAVGAEAARLVIGGLSSGSVFSYAPSAGIAKYVGVKVELPASSGEGKTVLENGATLHNAPSYLGG